MSIPENPVQAKLLFQLLRVLEQRAGVVAKPYVNSGPVIGHRPDNTWVISDEATYWLLVVLEAAISRSGNYTAFRLELFRARHTDELDDNLANHIYMGTWRFPPQQHHGDPTHGDPTQWLDKFWDHVRDIQQRSEKPIPFRLLDEHP